MNNRTTKNTNNNRGQRNKKDLENEIRIAWQESQFGNRTLRGEFDYELSFDVDDIRNVLDGDDAETSDEI